MNERVRSQLTCCAAVSDFEFSINQLPKGLKNLSRCNLLQYTVHSRVVSEFFLANVRLFYSTVENPY